MRGLKEGGARDIRSGRRCKAVIQEGQGSDAYGVKLVASSVSFGGGGGE